jgi:hypothetical protein
MQTNNSSLEKFKKANGGYMLRDISKPHKVLSIHAELQINEDHSKNPYYHNVTKRDISTAPLVPLLPGHCVIGKFGELYIYLEIQSNNEYLTYHWKIYDNVEMTQIIHEGTNPDFFISMKKYINWPGKISIPDILGFGDPDIIHDLQAKVNSIYPNIFETSVALTKSQNKMVKLTATMQKKGEKIIAKARNSLLISQDPIICQGIEIKETGLNLSSEATLALAIDYESSKKSSDALRKKFKCAKADLEYAKNLKYNQYEKKNKDSLKDWVQKTIEENKFGSTILVNTEQYLTNIFIQPCLTCHNLDLSKKKLKVNKIGYNLQITINCKMCQGITEYNNESPGTKFSLLAAGAGLVGGVNRRQLQTIFSMMGVTTQSSKGHYYDKQNEYLESIKNEAEVSAQIALTKAIAYIKAKGERILPTSFDCSWSHCRNANQASGELIFQGNLEGNTILLIG